MKKLKPQISIFILILFFVSSCNKDSENQSPTCEITSPSFGDEFIQGDIVNITVEANDPDGSIKEVRFYIDDVGKSSSNSFPYNYDWDTENVDEGNHSIKVVAIDDGSLQTEMTTEVNIQGKEGEFTDSRDNNTYKWVKIGEQTWMAENLAYLPSISPSNEYSDTSPNCYVYDYNGIDVNEAKATDYYKTYGVLYNWVAALESCPEGWHLPTDDEWNQLAQYISDKKGLGSYNSSENQWNDVGMYLKATSGWEYDGTGINGTNECEFNANPGGANEDGFGDIGEDGMWWSRSEISTHSAGLWDLYSGDSNLYWDDDAKPIGYSVRCVKD